MPEHDYRDPRLTEQRNPRTANIDVATSAEIVELLNAEDRTVAASVFQARESLAHVVDLVVHAFEAGGRLLYVGAGTSGRLGVLDAAECPPTFGSDQELVIAIIAGGTAAVTSSQEGAEDDVDAGSRAVDAHGVSNTDVVVGVAASGTTPFVTEALVRAKELGARSVFVTCSDPPSSLITLCDEIVVAKVGPEALTGSTRLKAGTATKLILNTITTGAMIRSGKAYGNLMVDLRALSNKLVDRGERIVMESCDVDRDTARTAIKEAEGSVKLAIVMVKCGTSAQDARQLLSDAGGLVRKVVGDPPPVLGG